MAWTTITYACGHEAEVQLYGNRRDRERRAEWLGRDICPACLAKQREEESRQAAAKNAEDEFVELEGSEKQIAWAETIRREIAGAVEEIRDSKITEAIEDSRKAAKRKERCEKNGREYRPHAFDGKTEEQITEAFELASYDVSQEIRNEPSAGKIIDRRFGWLEKRLEEVAVTYLDGSKKKSYSHTVSSEDPIYGIVDVQIVSGEHTKRDKLVVRGAKNEVLRKLVRRNHFEWNSDKYQWEKIMGPYAESLTDTAADIANRLLNAGFKVCFNNEVVEDMAVSGSFHPDAQRYISLGEKYLHIHLDEEDDQIKEDIHSLSRYGIRDYDFDGEVFVPRKFWEEISDIAERCDFLLNDEVKELFERNIERNAAEKVSVAPVTVQEDVSYLDDILNSSREVLDDLKD